VSDKPRRVCGAPIRRLTNPTTLCVRSRELGLEETATTTPPPPTTASRLALPSSPRTAAAPHHTQRLAARHDYPDPVLFLRQGRPTRRRRRPGLGGDWLAGPCSARLWRADGSANAGHRSWATSGNATWSSLTRACSTGESADVPSAEMSTGSTARRRTRADASPPQRRNGPAQPSAILLPAYDNDARRPDREAAQVRRRPLESARHPRARACTLLTPICAGTRRPAVTRRRRACPSKQTAAKSRRRMLVRRKEEEMERKGLLCFFRSHWGGHWSGGRSPDTKKPA
jgi:hypothetical protein